MINPFEPNYYAESLENVRLRHAMRHSKENRQITFPKNSIPVQDVVITGNSYKTRANILIRSALDTYYEVLPHSYTAGLEHFEEKKISTMKSGREVTLKLTSVPSQSLKLLLNSKSNPALIIALDSTGTKEENIKVIQECLEMYRGTEPWLDKKKPPITIFYDTSEETSFSSITKKQAIASYVNGLKNKGSGFEDLSLSFVETSAKENIGVLEGLQVIIPSLPPRSLDELKNENILLKQKMEVLNQTILMMGLPSDPTQDHILNRYKSNTFYDNPPQERFNFTKKKEALERGEVNLMLCNLDHDGNNQALAKLIKLEDACVIVISPNQSLESNQKFIQGALTSYSTSTNLDAGKIGGNKKKLFIFYDISEQKEHMPALTTLTDIQLLLKENPDVVLFETHAKAGGMEDNDMRIKEGFKSIATHLLEKKLSLTPALSALEDIIQDYQRQHMAKLIQLKISPHFLFEPEQVWIETIQKENITQVKKAITTYQCLNNLHSVLLDRSKPLLERENQCVQFLENNRQLLLKENRFVRFFQWIKSLFSTREVYVENYRKKYFSAQRPSSIFNKHKSDESTTQATVNIKKP